MSHSVIFENVTKKYKMYNKTSEKIMDMVVPDRYGEDFYALQNISFTADAGDVIGIIGVNGSGKSTLSNLITGILPPTEGEINIAGQASLIAIASGLDNQLSGRDNIELKCLMLGYNKKEIEELMPEIIEFAEIGKFIDQPVKSYSSGMKSRLGFAISVNIDPDILVIDEALSVGDQTFTDKCLDKMNEFKENGKTIFFVSHSIGQVKKFCQKALWLEAGEVKAYGTIKEIIPQYEKFLKEFKALSKEEQKNFKQLVLEKRGKIKERKSEQTVTKEQDEVISVPQGYSRANRNRKRSLTYKVKWILIIILLLAAVLAGIDYISKSGLLFNPKTEKTNSSIVSPEQEKGDPDKGEKIVENELSKQDIRYVTVESAFIRSRPEMNSEAIGTASFGQSYVVKESQRDLSDDVEWFKVANRTTEQEGWISGKVLAVTSDELNDNEVVEKVDQLIGFYPSLKEAIPMIGKNKGSEQSFDYTEYEYDKDQVIAFTITVNDSSVAEVINEIGEPQLKQQDVLLYHGFRYDFKFTVLSDEKINKLSVIER